MITKAVNKVVARNFILANSILCAGLVHSADLISLPEPLTLEYALDLSKNINPDLAFRLAEKEKITSEKSLTAAENGFNLSLEADINWVDRTNAIFTSTIDEQKLSLRLTKSIYDFGGNKYKLKASDKLLDSNSFEYQNEIYLRQVRIMESYFAVLLSDLRFHRNNENMAVAFISWDDSRKRNELGKISDLEVEKKHSEYQRVRRQRFESENNQRQTRNRLAILMYTNGQLPITLATPDLSDRIKIYPDLDNLIKRAFDNNLELRALRKKIQSVRSTILVFKSKMKPQINFESEATTYLNKYQVNTFSRENWNVGIVLDMPIYDSGKIDSEISKVQAEVYRLETLIRQKKAIIQHELLSLKLKLDTLRFERDEANAFNDYSELLLDEKRALYEMEVKATLGTAMVQISDAQYNVAKSLYETLLTWAKIDVLVGEEPAINLFNK
ncbi:MAG: TolC family protein [Thiohalomonadales bacterium]